MISPIKIYSTHNFMNEVDQAITLIRKMLKKIPLLKYGYREGIKENKKTSNGLFNWNSVQSKVHKPLFEYQQDNKHYNIL